MNFLLLLLNEIHRQRAFENLTVHTHIAHIDFISGIFPVGFRWRHNADVFSSGAGFRRPRRRHSAVTLTCVDIAGLFSFTFNPHTCARASVELKEKMGVGEGGQTFPWNKAVISFFYSFSSGKTKNNFLLTRFGFMSSKQIFLAR